MLIVDDTKKLVETAEAERDPIKRLDLRLNGGAGATFTPFQGNDRRSATISLGLIYSYENLSSAEPESAGPDPRFLSRWNLRVQGQQQSLNRRAGCEAVLRELGHIEP